MKVFVCTFTEQDINMVGRTFFTYEDAMKALAEALTPEIQDHIDTKLEEYVKSGYITLEEVEVEGAQEVIRVTTTTRGDEFLEDYDYREFVRLEVAGDTVFDACDGEPEDNSIGRNFNDCLYAADLVALGYRLGSKGNVNLKFSNTTAEE